MHEKHRDKHPPLRRNGHGGGCQHRDVFERDLGQDRRGDKAEPIQERIADEILLRTSASTGSERSSSASCTSTIA